MQIYMVCGAIVQSENYTVATNLSEYKTICELTESINRNQRHLAANDGEP